MTTYSVSSVSTGSIPLINLLICRFCSVRSVLSGEQRGSMCDVRIRLAHLASDTNPGGGQPLRNDASNQSFSAARHRSQRSVIGSGVENNRQF